MFFGLITLCSCSDEPPIEPSEEQIAENSLTTGQFAGWQYYDYENFRLFYPPGHPQYIQFEEIASGYKKALRGMCKVLNTEIPNDTITIVFYPDYKTGMQMTGQDYSYVEGNKIHFWLPGFYGVTLTQWYLPKWLPEPTQNEFLRHGLITLFDHSGQNYHEATLRFIEENRFLPLATLAIDENINSNVERYNSTEAASFCGFVLAWYGPEVMKGMYKYQGDFDTFVRGAFEISVDSLETLWIEVIRANQPDTSKN